jgi:hypothetical protein
MPTSNNVNAPWQPRPGQGVADNAGGLFSKMLGYDDQSGEFDFNSDKLNLYSPAQTTGFLSKAKQQLETSNQQVQQGAAMSGGARGAAGPDLASINQQQTDAANRGALAGLNFDIHNAGVEQGRGLLDTLAPLVDSAKNRETDLALAGFRMTPGAMQAQDLTWEDAFPLFQQHGGEWDAVDAQGNVFKKDAAGQIVEFDGVTPLSLEKLQDPMQVKWRAPQSLQDQGIGAAQGPGEYTTAAERLAEDELEFNYYRENLQANLATALQTLEGQQAFERLQSTQDHDKFMYDLKVIDMANTATADDLQQQYIADKSVVDTFLQNQLEALIQTSGGQDEESIRKATWRVYAEFAQQAQFTRDAWALARRQQGYEGETPEAAIYDEEAFNEHFNRLWAAVQNIMDDRPIGTPRSEIL